MNDHISWRRKKINLLKQHHIYFKDSNLTCAAATDAFNIVLQNLTSFKDNGSSTLISLIFSITYKKQHCLYVGFNNRKKLQKAEGHQFYISVIKYFKYKTCKFQQWFNFSNLITELKYRHSSLIPLHFIAFLTNWRFAHKGLQLTKGSDNG